MSGADRAQAAVSAYASGTEGFVLSGRMPAFMFMQALELIVTFGEDPGRYASSRAYDARSPVPTQRMVRPSVR
eukprot:3517536-Rhodomonas_salina.3